METPGFLYCNTLTKTGIKNNPIAVKLVFVSAWFNKPLIMIQSTA